MSRYGWSTWTKTLVFALRVNSSTRRTPDGCLEIKQDTPLPETPGVYAWVANERVMYSGVAWGIGGLRRRLVNDHCRAPPPPPLRFNTEAVHDMRDALASGQRVHIFVRVCADKASALALEEKIIREFQPQWNGAGTKRQQRKGGSGWAAGRAARMAERAQRKQAAAAAYRNECP
jgi:hypothetical protein